MGSWRARLGIISPFREGPEVDAFYITCSRWWSAANIALLKKRPADL
jgi:hypothetical protein